MFRERTLSRLKRRAPLGRLALLLWDAVPHPAKGAFLKKRPLEPSKTFFRGVKAKPDGLSVFRAGTLSRLKRQSLFSSCRREASPKTQGLSEDASHHARKHKTPTEGTANNIHRPAPKNQQLRYSGFLTLPLKVCCLSAEKVFGSTPFSKGVAGLQGGEPCKENRVAGRDTLQGCPGLVLEFHFLKATGCPLRRISGVPPRSRGRTGPAPHAPFPRSPYRFWTARCLRQR